MSHRCIALLLILLSPLAGALDLHGMAPDEITVWAAPVEGGAPLEAHRADVAVQPASTMKLLTSWAALTRLGPDYRWKTRFASSAPVVNGVLKGDLYWVGSGDPRFLLSDLRSMLYDLRLQGIHTIEGRLVLDKQAYRDIGSADGFAGDAERLFSVAPDTHLLEWKTAWLRLEPEADGWAVRLDPPLSGVRVSANLLRGGNGPCTTPAERVSLQQSGLDLYLSGTLPPACAGERLPVNLPLDHDTYATEAFRSQWELLGGKGPAGLDIAPLPADARDLVQHLSPPLGTLLADVNKYSNNPMARSVYLALGQGSARTAAAVIADTLAQAGLPTSPLVLENGAGLSRTERVSATLLGNMLLSAARQPHAADFVHTLPAAGEEGPLKRRFAALGPRLRLKTGTLDNVRALAGYWQARDGRRLALVAIVNSPRAPALLPALDAVVVDIVRRFDAQAGGR